MLRSSSFWTGVIVGVIAPIAWHKFYKPIPTNKA